MGRGGVVRDAAKRLLASRRVREVAEDMGLRCLDEAESVLAGPKGNRERFVLLRQPSPTDLARTAR